MSRRVNCPVPERFGWRASNVSIKPRTRTEVLGAVELVARASGRRTLSSPWCNDYPFAPEPRFLTWLTRKSKTVRSCLSLLYLGCAVIDDADLKLS
jgi:hypothetical protein